MNEKKRNKKKEDKKKKKDEGEQLENAGGKIEEKKEELEHLVKVGNKMVVLDFDNVA